LPRRPASRVLLPAPQAGRAVLIRPGSRGRRGRLSTILPYYPIRPVESDCLA
jgi:hypothetical protein